MSSDTTSLAAPPPHEGRRGYNIQSLLTNFLMYGGIVFMLMSILGNIGDQTTRSSDKQSQVERVRPDTFSPFAKPGDRFRIFLESPELETIDFDNLLFSFDFLSSGRLKHDLLLNLSSCASRNCSMELTVSWEMRGTRFSTEIPLVRFFPVKQRNEHHLFGGTAANHTDGERKVSSELVYRAYFQPVVTLSPIVDFSAPPPEPLKNLIKRIPGTNQYEPLVYINNFWVLKDHLLELNASTAAMRLFPLTVEVSALALWKLALYNQYETSMKQQQDLGLAKPEDAEDTKRIFLETNPYFLALTALVTCLHMAFEYLAFSNDVKFWRGRKDLRGLSIRSIAINCYFQAIVFLYLLDGEETSWAILLPSGVGVLMEFWKLRQTITIRRCGGGTSTDEEHLDSLERSGKQWMTLFGYEICFKESYDNRTRKHDDTAIRYLVYAMVPILSGYCVYSALYKTHKGWYSYLINTQVQFIYFFGFVMMTPQIFINYKMKSVGQMPWRTFVYKALNTVIDDLFAFIIKMPWLHRIACFRDDVVFAILLYQRWIYPVDMARLADDEDVDAEEEDASGGVESTEARQPEMAASDIELKKNQ